MTEKQTTRPRLTAKKKFEIYLGHKGRECPSWRDPAGERAPSLRLRIIEETVEYGAIENLKRRSGKAKNAESVSGEDYNALLHQLEKKEKALADLAVEF